MSYVIARFPKLFSLFLVRSRRRNLPVSNLEHQTPSFKQPRSSFSTTTQQEFHKRQICRRRHFRIRRGARHQLHRLPDQFAGRRVVGHLNFARADFPQSPPDNLHPKRLRRLHRPKFRTIHITGNDFAVGSFLDRIRHRMTRHRCTNHSRRLDGSRNELCSRARPRAVLDCHNFRSG